MATLVEVSPERTSLTASLKRFAQGNAAARYTIFAVLTLSAIAIHGYHPYTEDGGIYIAAAEHALDPSLFPAYTYFADAHITAALFARIVATLASATGISIISLFFIGHLLSIWLTIVAVWKLSERCFCTARARWGAVVLFVVTLSLPAAGTALTLMDPYLTSRSLAMPLVLLGLATLMDQSKSVFRTILYTVPLFAFAVFLHPLLAACGIFLAALQWAISNRRFGLMFAFVGFSLALCGALHHLAPSEPAAYQQVVQRCGYWYLTGWQWYEVFGAIAPLFLLYRLARWKPAFFDASAVSLLQACVIAGVVAIIMNLAFVHPRDSSYLVASLQPLRIFQLIYLCMVLAFGALAALRFPLRGFVAAGMAVVIAVVMFQVQRSITPATVHLELPWMPPSNQWEKAFLWARSNTPKDALFALDAGYISSSGEDAHLFRAIALRSALPDRSKDAGITAVKPSLSDAWLQGVSLQQNLNGITDDERLARLRKTGATWIVFPSNVSTRFSCPYTNVAVRVCRLP